MYHLMEEDLARVQHWERTTNLELEHRHKLAASLRPHQPSVRVNRTSR